ncbi:MAG: type II toxin-antitoxin system PemK/MazF family toxin [Lachnospiraceae bacterium]|nr:type II toxin-antitoxin system PemK/MazF family toxin [Lachnospiraceae bacterium]
MEVVMMEIKRGDIFLADLGESIGSVQRGERPVLVVQNNKGNKYSPTVTVIPITTKIHKSKEFPTHTILENIGGLDEKSASMAEQITTIGREKLMRYIGSLPESFMKNVIDETLCIQLEIKGGRKTWKECKKSSSRRKQRN